MAAILAMTSARAQGGWEVDQDLLKNKTVENIALGLSNMVYQVDGCWGQAQGWMSIGRFEMAIGFGWKSTESQEVESRYYTDNIGINHHVSVAEYTSGGVAQYLGFYVKRFLSVGIIGELSYGTHRWNSHRQWVESTSFTEYYESNDNKFGVGIYGKLSMPLNEYFDLFLAGQAVTDGNMGFLCGVTWWML